MVHEALMILSVLRTNSVGPKAKDRCIRVGVGVGVGVGIGVGVGVGVGVGRGGHGGGGVAMLVYTPPPL